MKLTHYFIVSVIFFLLISSPVESSEQALKNIYCDQSKSCKKGSTTILGTWQWDIDGNQLKTSRTADLWWNHINRNKRELVPINGAYIKHIGHGECGSYGPYEIMRAGNASNEVLNSSFTKAPIKEMEPLSIFKESAIFAVITNQRRLARLFVRGFRTNQEFYFREAYLLEKPAQQPGRSSENRYFHMILDWTIFKNFDLMPYMEAPE